MMREWDCALSLPRCLVHASGCMVVAKRIVIIGGMRMSRGIMLPCGFMESMGVLVDDGVTLADSAMVVVEA